MSINETFKKQNFNIIAANKQKKKKAHGKKAK